MGGGCAGLTWARSPPRFRRTDGDLVSARPPAPPRRPLATPAWAACGVAAVAAAAGCGDVRFVVSPYAPDAVQVVYSQQEDVTIVRWRLAAAPPLGADTTFELLGADGTYAPLDFGASYFPGGAAACR